jgi:hypothetical protein
MCWTSEKKYSIICFRDSTTNTYLVRETPNVFFTEILQDAAVYTFIDAERLLKLLNYGHVRPNYGIINKFACLKPKP